MPPKIRVPTIDELPGLSDLCFRSKAVWGYDKEFMERCRGELSFHPQDLERTSVALAEDDGRPLGVVQLKIDGREAVLLKLFVEPCVLRRGIGSALLAWAVDVSKRMAAARLIIDADPDAAGFYRRMGACDIGQAASGSIPGRMLPRLAMNLADQPLDPNPALAADQP